jgi:hypothetical protein
VSERIDSARYRATFYGILNEQGQFWTCIAFDAEEKARQHIRDFWRNDKGACEQCLRTHKIVPVRIRLETIPDKAPPHAN